MKAVLLGGFLHIFDAVFSAVRQSNVKWMFYTSVGVLALLNYEPGPSLERAFLNEYFSTPIYPVPTCFVMQVARDGP